MTMRVVSLVMLVLLVAPLTAQADDALWTLLKRGGHIVLIRHANAPGTFDPPGMRTDDCSTQRNLDEQGREEARRIGLAFRAREIPVGAVRSSRWCRCLETARLAFGRVEHWWALDGFLRSPELEAPHTAQVRAVARQPFTGPNLVFVTHQFNIRALTGLSPVSGEIVVLTPKGSEFAVAGSIPPSALTVSP